MLAEISLENLNDFSLRESSVNISKIVHLKVYI